MLGNVGVANNSGLFIVTAFRFVSSRMSTFDSALFIVSFFLCFWPRQLLRDLPAGTGFVSDKATVLRDSVKGTFFK